jgi:NADH:ubiquinone oxidoreductase subunit F (NADH-binding)
MQPMETYLRAGGAVVSVLDGERSLLPDEPVTTLDAYVAAGGGSAFAKAVSLPRTETIDVVARAGLRGRGGAGFPTAMKWGGLLRDQEGAKYLCCNAAEGEPATFKDRMLIRTDPYTIVEGLAIAAYAAGAEGAYIVTKRGFERESAALTRAVSELQASGLIGGTQIDLVLGPDHYLLGEEKALLEVIEGNDPLPRHFPPYVQGLFATPQDPNPAVVNNVETLFNVPAIVRWGPEWFRSAGSETSPGSMLFTLLGDVRRPGMYELPLGFPLSSLLHELGGGPAPGRRIKAVLSGASNRALVEGEFDIPLDFDALGVAGSGLGSAGFAVYDDSACMVRVAQIYSRFLYVESCGQCPPCKLHSGDVSEALAAVDAGAADFGDLDDIIVRCSMVTEAARCALPNGVAALVPGLMHSFRDEFEAHLNGEGCPLPRALELPKIADYVPGAGFTFDERQVLKRPNWTYAG